MKRTSIFLAMSALTLAGCSAGGEDNAAVPPDAYEGLSPPGMVPELMAPGLVTTDDLEVLPALSPDLKEFYFVRQGREFGSPGYRMLHRQGNEWTLSEVETTEGTGEVFVSPDGQVMHLGHEYREMTENGWSELKSLGAAYERYDIMRLTASSSGTYVFDERDENGLLRYSRMVDGTREEPVAFGEAINQGTYTAHPFIAPDESYLIFDSNREDGFGDSDLYVSFREVDGSWGEPINLGDEINTQYEDIFGSVTSDGKYFIYSTVNLEEPSANIFWVDARVIEELRP